ncbi:hypothetical protein BGW36DRAFT_358799 [Talaromyces proteolyticus]|uniref:Uncharacterized protein n=1 Tax=Talaromyces proteolyticus TaxID=1131652 RepID=A0AAD4KU34_9EURO|nr:uncharacterized protein BGW36DRAFT_358799 [Talaromyces proteolyticus]KAH8699301.1 hypothetical protein BGW36DRAFT_358799 [Talaromyces proteolyticus]
MTDSLTLNVVSYSVLAAPYSVMGCWYGLLTETSFRLIVRLELFILPSSLYPRQVLIYLSEKHLSTTSTDPAALMKITPVTTMATLQMAAPGKRPGSVAILALNKGTFIKQSIATLEYLEDMCDNFQRHQEAPDHEIQSQMEMQ